MLNIVIICQHSHHFPMLTEDFSSGAPAHFLSLFPKYTDLPVSLCISPLTFVPLPLSPPKLLISKIPNKKKIKSHSFDPAFSASRSPFLADPHHAVQYIKPTILFLFSNTFLSYIMSSLDFVIHKNKCSFAKIRNFHFTHLLLSSTARISTL